MDSRNNSVKNITILLPCVGNFPSGGFKVVYEYANRLSADGVRVHIVYPVYTGISRPSIKTIVKSFIQWAKHLKHGYKCSNWFKLDHRVKEHLVFSLHWPFVPKSDRYIATAVSTSVYLNCYPVKPSCKFYFIQDFENWNMCDEDVEKTYRFGMNNITISNWLAKKVQDSGAECTVIKNGFDFNYFKLTIPITDKNRYSVAMLYHYDERKGCIYGLEALKIVKNKYPQLNAILFGVPCRPDNLPEWITYHQCPDKDTHNNIYNQCAIYLAPSLQEGWGLTVGEAMICGAAVVCTDTLGFKEMITNNVNGYIVPAADSEALADKILYLIENDDKRISLATNAEISIRAFSWDRSYANLRKLLLS